MLFTKSIFLPYILNIVIYIFYYYIVYIDTIYSNMYFITVDSIYSNEIVLLYILYIVIKLY